VTEPTVTVLPELPDAPHRTGRHIQHDPRSVGYAAGVWPWRHLQSADWSPKIPVLDQEDLHAQGIHVEGDPDALGSCTCQAGTYAVSSLLGADHLGGITLLDERWAIGLYKDVTRADDVDGQWPPDDTGSTGLAVGKVLRGRGLIAGYRHAFSLRATISAMQTSGVLLGVPWSENMFNPDADGRVRLGGQPAGGHEIYGARLDMDRRRIHFPNSWSPAWGLNGWGYLTFDDLADLLDQQGDATILH
jgi:hypothetical protein